MCSFPGPFAFDTVLDTVLDTAFTAVAVLDPRNALKEPKSPAGPSKLTICSKQQLFVRGVCECQRLYPFAYRITTSSLDSSYWSVLGVEP